MYPVVFLRKLLFYTVMYCRLMSINKALIVRNLDYWFTTVM
jgi:hypothetical protein